MENERGLNVKKRFKVDVWDCYVTFTTSKAYYAKVSSSDVDCGEFGGATLFDGNEVTIFLNADTFMSACDPKALRTLSHECNHAAMSILDARGVTFDGDSQEALAYTQDYIFGECYKILLSNENKEVKDGANS